MSARWTGRWTSAVKGWMLVWPQGDEVLDEETGEFVREEDRRLGLVLAAMRESFTSLGAAALDDNAGLDTATQSIDLVSGLEIRRPEKSRSGFYVSDTGAVLTTTEAVAGCGRITLDEAVYHQQVSWRAIAHGRRIILILDREGNVIGHLGGGRTDQGGTTRQAQQANQQKPRPSHRDALNRLSPASSTRRS